MTQLGDAAAIKSRSYEVRHVLDALGADLDQPASLPLALPLTRGACTWPQGTPMAVRSFANAGFRGIEVAALAPDGTLLMFSAGLLDTTEAEALLEADS